MGSCQGSTVILRHGGKVNKGLKDFRSCTTLKEPYFVMTPPRESHIGKNPVKWKSPIVAVDAVIQMEDGSIIFIQRKNPPFQGQWALPGGQVEVGETVEAAIIREVKEETGLKIKVVRLIGVFSDPQRDPRGHTVSIAFFVHPIGGVLSAGSDASQAEAFREPPDNLAFDHETILQAAGIVMGGEDRKTR
ncbi:MAG: NUDIX domain-containing protein [Candidatus Hermodarchaeia archaeon]